VDNAKALLNQLFFDPKRYDLTRVGRYKLNSRLKQTTDLDTRTLTKDDIIALVKELVELPKILGIPEDGEVEIKDYAAEAQSMPREPVASTSTSMSTSATALRTVGELVQEAFRIGLYRMERVVRERLTTEDADTITRRRSSTSAGRGGAEGVLRLPPSCRSSWTRPTPSRPHAPPASLGAWRRWAHARARAIEVRDVHPPLRAHVPIETPEDPTSA